MILQVIEKTKLLGLLELPDNGKANFTRRQRGKLPIEMVSRKKLDAGIPMRHQIGLGLARFELPCSTILQPVTLGTIFDY
jgi:hypothetical protein